MVVVMDGVTGKGRHQTIEEDAPVSQQHRKVESSSVLLNLLSLTHSSSPDTHILCCALLAS